jgi:rhamnose utilization protein RhaD (predicted bifunctional aldolase and dehydrogenase)
MQNLWSDEEAKEFKSDLDLRVYTSNLLGRSEDLVLHGGGNTSVKSIVDGQDILFVKGSGWDLVSIKKEGFAPVELTMLKDMAKLESLTDTDMVAAQREAMIDKSAPNPSVEAILHAIIPFKYVDHTHADAVVTISNSKTGIENIKKLYPNFLIIPYIMPGFKLAREVYLLTKDMDWSKCDGIILHNHGIFTFDDDAKKSYDKMIEAVTIAENFLEKNSALEIESQSYISFDVAKFQSIISNEKESKITLCIDNSDIAIYYSNLDNSKLTRGVLTPEHIIRTKRNPLVLENNNIQDAVDKYKSDYQAYFDKFSKDEIMLNPAPNYAVIKGFGVVTFGKDKKEAQIISDIVIHTMRAVLRADKLGGYQSISEKDSFEMEYWELEQAKLRK